MVRLAGVWIRVPRPGGVPCSAAGAHTETAAGDGTQSARSSSSPEHLLGRGTLPRCFCFPRKQPHLLCWFQLASPPLCLKINKKSEDTRLLGKAEWHLQNICPAWGDGGWRGCPCLPARHRSGPGSWELGELGEAVPVPVPRSAVWHGRVRDGLRVRWGSPAPLGEPLAGELCPVTPCLGFGPLLWCSLCRDSWADSIVCPDM